MSGRRAHTRISIAVLLTTAIGCVKAPPRVDPKMGFQVPPSWTAVRAAVGVTPASWWLEFGDPQLDAAIAEALANNYDLALAAATLERAQAQARIVGSDLSPQIDAGFSGSRTKQNFIGFDFVDAGGGGATGGSNSVLSTTTNRFGLSVDVSWEIDLWGRIRSATAAALADMQATAADQQAVRLSVAAQTAKAWYAAIEARDQLALAEETVRSYRTTTRQVEARYERGVRPALDLRLALTELEGAEALVQQREQNLDIAIRQLETLLGRYPARALEPESQLPKPLGQVPAALPAEVVSRRPDLVASERTLAATGARVASARAALYPRLALTSSSGTASEQISDLLKSDFGIWSIAGNLVQPILQGGRLVAAVDAARAEQKQALARYASAVLAAYREVETFLAAESTLRARAEHLKLASEQSVAARDLADLRYLSGLDDYVTVLAAQRNALTAESSYIAVRNARVQNRIDLYLALGGGFDAADLFEQYRAPSIAGDPPRADEGAMPSKERPRS